MILRKRERDFSTCEKIILNIKCRKSRENVQQSRNVYNGNANKQMDVYKAKKQEEEEEKKKKKKKPRHKSKI